MQEKGLDFKHKEVINIKNGTRLGYVQDGCREKKGYITKNNQSRTGYVLKEKYIYDAICKVEL